MARYRFRALDREGRDHAGVIEASDRQAAVAGLRGRGLTVLDVAETDANADVPLLERDFLGPEHLPDRALARIARELATLLEARVPMDRALAILGRIAPDRKLRRWTDGVADRVREGNTLSDAFATARPPVEDRHLGLVRAGEASGTLPDALEELAGFLERSLATRSRIRSALTYPAFVLIVAFLTLIVLVTVVLPSFEGIFAGAGRAMPEPAASILGVGNWMRANVSTIAAGSAGLFAFLVLVTRAERGRVALSALWLALPLVGDIRRQMDTARFCRTFALLSGNGVETVTAARSAIAALGSPALRQRLAAIEPELTAGAPLSAALRDAGALTPIAADLAEVGEEAGRLPAMLRHAADFVDGQAEERAGRLVTLIAPFATIVLGGLVAVVILSVMSAMLQLNELI